MGTIFVDNIREHTASHGVHIPGHICQVVTWTVAENVRSTSGSWAANTVPTLPNTYDVEKFLFTKKFSNSKVVFQASGHVDHESIGGGSPSIVCLFTDDNEVDSASGFTLIGSAYRHVRYNNDEPFGYNFAGEDTTTGLIKYYKLRCHSGAASMRFSRMAAGSGIGNLPYRILFWEVMQ